MKEKIKIVIASAGCLATVWLIVRAAAALIADLIAALLSIAMWAM